MAGRLRCQAIMANCQDRWFKRGLSKRRDIRGTTLSPWVFLIIADSPEGRLSHMLQLRSQAFLLSVPLKGLFPASGPSTELQVTATSLWNCGGFPRVCRDGRVAVPGCSLGPALWVRFGHFKVGSASR
jgi:hypothetical protein